MMRLILISMAVLFTTCSLSSGQDPQFTQFYAAPLYLSPSFAGASGHTRIIMNLRDQWSKLPGDFQTYALSADHYFEKYNSGAGILITRDLAGGGLVNTTNIGLNYNYSFSLNKKWRLSPGIQVYYYIKNINYNRLIFSDQISRDFISPVSIEMERLVSIKPVQHLDFTGSLLAFSDRYWAGFSFDHLIALNKTLVEEGGYIPLRLTINGGGKYYISGASRRSKEESITGAFNFTLQDHFKYLDLGAYYTRSPIQFGLWYRGLPVFSDNPNIGAITAQFGYRANNFIIGYSYDYTISRLMTRTGGAHEISLAYELRSGSKRKKIRMVPCPSFMGDY
jgi:type IX secretion system PorP/SprF family membrane protein